MSEPVDEEFPNAFVRLCFAAIEFREHIEGGEQGLVAAAAAAGLGLPPGGDSNGRNDALFQGVDSGCLTTIHEKSVELSCAVYPGWTTLARRLSALAEGFAFGRSVERVRLAYFDEVRPPEPTRADGWSDWVKLPVLQPSGLGNIASMYGGLLICEDEQHRQHISVEWGHSTAPLIEDSHPLSRFYEQHSDAVLSIEWFAYRDCPDDGSEAADVELQLDEMHSDLHRHFFESLTDQGLELMKSGTK